MYRGRYNYKEKNRYIERHTDEEGKKILESAQPEEVKIVLPIDELTAQQGKKSPVSNALSWLWEFCKRTILKYPGKVIWPQE